MESAELERILVVADGAMKAHFRDGSLLLLSAKGDFYQHVSSDGSCARHLTSCALQRHGQRLQQVLAFRNLYFRESIYNSWVMDNEAQRRTFEPPYVATPKWTASNKDELERSKIYVGDGIVRVDSIDGAYRLVYDEIGKRVSVRAPQTVPIENGDDTTRCILDDKVFSVYDMPHFWLAPLRIAIGAYRQKIENREFSEAEDLERTIAIREETALDAVSDYAATEPCRSEFKSAWWYRNTAVLPDNDPVFLEWTENVLYQYTPSTSEAHAWIQQDGSYLETIQKGRFVHHRRLVPSLDRLYHASSKPASTISLDGKALYDLASIIERLCAIRSAGSRIDDRQSLVPNREQPLSVQICEERVTDAGVFIAYVDGRVRVKFADRTLLHLNPSGEMCEVVLKTGERCRVSCSAPSDVESYISAAQSFRIWAFSTDAERDQIAQMRQELELAALRCRINAAVCDWESQRKRIS